MEKEKGNNKVFDVGTYENLSLEDLYNQLNNIPDFDEKIGKLTVKNVVGHV